MFYMDNKINHSAESSTQPSTQHPATRPPENPFDRPMETSAQYIDNLITYVAMYPFNQWTSAYMAGIFGIINTSINNHNLEETLKTLNAKLYQMCLQRRRLIVRTIYRLKTINIFYRLHLWNAFVRAYSQDPHDYFLESMNELRTFSCFV